MAPKMHICELFTKHLGQHIGDTMMAKIDELARAKVGAAEICSAIQKDLDEQFKKVKADVAVFCEKVSQPSATDTR